MSDLLIIMMLVALGYLAGLGRAVAPHLDRIIWALRCPPDSPNYKCPPADGRRSALSDILRRRRL